MLYDWANSAYSVVITTAIFPIYYKSVATAQGVNTVNSTAYLAYTVSIATLILAILGPLLGAVANYEGMKKKLFFTFFAIGSVATFSLAFVPSDNWLLLLILYVFTAVGFHGANIFYDSFLVDVTTYERMDYISAKGFGLGYIGSTIPFLASIVIIISAQMEWISLSVSTASKLAFIITAVW